jgi:hypothetical protein
LARLKAFLRGAFRLLKFGFVIGAAIAVVVFGPLLIVIFAGLITIAGVAALLFFFAADVVDEPDEPP